MLATVSRCTACFALSAVIVGVGTGRKIVPGTGRLDCGHIDTETVGDVDVARIVHLSLSTLLRMPEVLADRDSAHRIQEWLKVPATGRRVSGMPWPLVSGHDVTSEGLATARILARTMSSLVDPGEAFYWRAAAALMRVRVR